MSPLGWLLLLGFPAIAVAAVLYPAFAILRYRVVLTGGRAEGYRRLRRAASAVLGVSTLGAYAVSFAAAFTDALPGLRQLMAGGGLALIVPLLFVDILVGAFFSVDRAERSHRARCASSRREGGDHGTDARIP